MEEKEAPKDEKKHYSPMDLPNPFTLQSFSQEKIAYMSLYDTERWYPDVKDFTFETEFMELTPEEGRALVHHYQEHILGRKALLSNEEKDLLADLDKRLQEVMDSFCEKDPSSEFFVRLSSRSPKDVGLGPEHPKVVQWLEEEVNKFGGIENASPNDVLRSVQTAAGKVLRVKTAAEALWLIENSERTFGDLIHTLDHLAEWEMKLVVRKWRDGVDVGTEFRAFMVEGVLTAISQYNDSCFYHELVGKEELIVNKILEFWEGMKSHVKYQAAIVDFVLVDDFTKVYCVELNPFGPMTGAALFDWRYERRLLQRGKDLWNDFSECQERAMAGEGDLRYQEFFANDSEKPVLRILHSPPESATESLMDSIPVVRALKRKNKKEKEEKQEKEKKEKEAKSNCALQ